jgi:hypothetical protein
VPGALDRHRIEIDSVLVGINDREVPAALGGQRVAVGIGVQRGGPIFRVVQRLPADLDAARAEDLG